MFQKTIVVPAVLALTAFVVTSGESFSQGRAHVELVESWNLNLGLASVDDHLTIRQSVRWVVDDLEQKQAEQLTSLMSVLSKDIPADPGEALLKEGIRLTTLEIAAKRGMPSAKAVVLLKYAGEEPRSLSLVTSTALPRRIPGKQAGTVNALFERKLQISIDSQTLQLAECIWHNADGPHTFPPTASAATRRVWVSLSGAIDDRSSRLLRRTKRLWGSNGEYPLPLGKVDNISAKWPKEMDDHAFTVKLPGDVDSAAPYTLLFTYTVKKAEVEPKAVWSLLGGEETTSFTLQSTARLGTAVNDDGDMASVQLPIIVHLSWFKKKKAVKDSSE